MPSQEKRYKIATSESHKDRQLSSLFNIISNNLLLATEVLSTDYKIDAVQKLESLSRKARTLAKDLTSNTSDIDKDDLTEKISYIKHNMLDLIVDLTEELGKLESNKQTDSKSIEDVILARRLLRESQRGLITIQD